MPRSHNGLPRRLPCRAVGLLGGSFDPPHAGHVHVSREALNRFGLDRIWWLVSPGNPLKREIPAPVEMRLKACRALLAHHPRLESTDYELHTDTRHTAETLEALFHDCPGQRFVWLMGADNLADFHRWERWEWIMENIPIGVIARSGRGIPARLSPAARRFARFLVPGRNSRALAWTRPPAWCFIDVPTVDISSTAIRERGEWRE